MTHRLKYTPRRRSKVCCPCKPEPDSNSCSDDRYLCGIMTSKDVLYPAIDEVSIHPTENEILTGFRSKELKLYRDAFDYFDKECKGVIKVNDVNHQMHTLGETAVLPEMMKLMVDVSAEGDGTIDFNGFLRIIARSKVDTDREEKIRKAFQVLDPKATGFIPANELRFALINLGEILTDEQVDIMLPQLDINDDGMVYYEDIVQLLSERDFFSFTGEEEEEEEEQFEMPKGRRIVDCPVYTIESASSRHVSVGNGTDVGTEIGHAMKKNESEKKVKPVMVDKGV